MAGRALVRRKVQEQLMDRVYDGVLEGSLPPAAGSIIRITHAEWIQFETRHGAVDLGGVPEWSTPGTDWPSSATAICRGRPRGWVAAPPRSPATSSANASWASPGNPRQTGACRSRTQAQQSLNGPQNSVGCTGPAAAAVEPTSGSAGRGPPVSPCLTSSGAARARSISR